MATSALGGHFGQVQSMEHGILATVSAKQGNDVVGTRPNKQQSYIF